MSQSVILPWYSGVCSVWITIFATAQYGLGCGSGRLVCGVVTAAEVMSNHRNRGITVDTGMVVVIFISMMYIVLVFILLFYVKNDWCDLLFNNMTVSMKLYYSSFVPKHLLWKFNFLQCFALHWST